MDRPTALNYLIEPVSYIDPSEEHYQAELAIYNREYATWIEANPEPKRLEWESPEFYAWFKAQGAPPPLKEEEVEIPFLSAPPFIRIQGVFEECLFRCQR